MIPRALLPVFAHLRAHCTALAAQNDELLAVLAEASVDGGGGSAASNGAPATASEGQPKRRQVDLAKVVDRLRVLSDENRELEGVVESLGRQVGEARGLKAALEGARSSSLSLPDPQPLLRRSRLTFGHPWLVRPAEAHDAILTLECVRSSSACFTRRRD